MTSRFILIALLLLLAVGLYRDFSIGSERDRLQSQYQRLKSVAGELDIADPSKIYIQALKSDDPLHWSWRVYTPPKCSIHFKGSTVVIPISMREANDFIVHLALQKDVEGRVQTYFGLSTLSNSGFTAISSRGLRGAKDYSDWLFEHKNDINVAQLEIGKVFVLEPTETIDLLTLTLPDSLKHEPIAQKSPFETPDRLPLIFQLTLEPPPPSQKK